jgi:hypothetical protein
MAQPNKIAESELGREEFRPPLRKPWKPGAQAPGQEGGLELQREPPEEQLQPTKRRARKT